MIADEAHSSQTGTAAATLKQLLSPQALQELEDGGEVDTEDLLAAQMTTRASPAGITYVAFTATPKNLLKIFGKIRSEKQKETEQIKRCDWDHFAKTLAEHNRNVARWRRLQGQGGN